MPANTAFYDAQELAELLGISKSAAYLHIRNLNKELGERGYLSPKPGLVSKKLVHEKFMLEDYIPETTAAKTGKKVI